MPRSKENKMSDVTTEQMQQHYSAALDSVNLLNNGKPSEFTAGDWVDCVQRNVDHLKLIVAKPWWTSDFDLEPLHRAIADNTIDYA